MVPRLEHPELGEVRQVGVPIRLSDTPGAIRGFAPWKGQHVDEVLREVGYDDGAIARFKDQQVV